jgi:predicted NAD/FAD-dependent oxidoreductase
MKRVAVLGGGPAGAFAAERLARAGMETVVLDEKLAWENLAAGDSATRRTPDIRFCSKTMFPRRSFIGLAWRRIQRGPST